MRCVGLLIAIRISGTAALRGWMVVDAGLASGTAELEPVGVPGNSDWVSVPGVAVLGVWDSEPGEPVLGVWDSEPGVPALGVWNSGRSGHSQEKRASLPEQQRLASGNVSGKLIGAS